MNTEVNVDNKVKKSKLKWIIPSIFIACIVLVCDVVFLLHYDAAYSTESYILPANWEISVYYLPIIFAALILAGIIKVIFDRRVSFGVLVMTALLLPMMVLNINYVTLKEGGILHPLVAEGGMLHFMTIGDFDFDGMNDEQHHLLYEVRESRNAISINKDKDPNIKRITTTATGIGAGLSGYCDLDEQPSILKLKFERENVEYKKIEIEVLFNSEQMAEKAEFYLLDSETETLIDSIINEDGTVSLVFDAETCAEWQQQEKEYYVEKHIKYYVDR